MPDARLLLDSGVASAIRRHGEETYPHECCGVLLGKEYAFDLVRPGIGLYGGGPEERPDERLVFLLNWSDAPKALSDATPPPGPTRSMVISSPAPSSRVSTSWRTCA